MGNRYLKVMDVQNIDENYRQLNEMLEKALNSIKDDTNLSTNSNIKNKNSNDKKQSKISNHFKSDESNNLATILHEVKQDLNMTDDVYRSLTIKVILKYLFSKKIMTIIINLIHLKKDNQRMY